MIENILRFRYFHRKERDGAWEPNVYFWEQVGNNTLLGGSQKVNKLAVAQILTR